MSQLSQDNRPFRVDTVLEPDTLLLSAFSGTEGISQPFAFRLEMLSEDPSISADDLLRTQMLVTVNLENGEQRHIHGHVSRFALLDAQEDLYTYRAEIVPWFWFLSVSSDCRIFQDQDVLSIVETVFTDQGFTDFDNRCARSYEPREYCVQYRETHLNFVSRLLEEEGIFYWFEHTDTTHTLVLADDNNLTDPCPHKETALLRPDASTGGEDVVTDLRTESSVHAGTVTLRDYDFEQPVLDLTSAVTGTEQQEIYDFHPGRFTDLDAGERYAVLALEVMEAARQRVTGAGDCKAFLPGFTFELEDHFAPALNDRYLLIEVSHSGSAGDYRSWDTADFSYHNQFTAIPAGVIFRPPRIHRKPLMKGVQSALVVGPAGEEVWTDEYGRVKVQFFWDRLGQFDENSSCWVRVATPWAGKNWGSISIPRIHNEVLIEFLEGDPDRPLIVGSVYNADQMPPFGLPDSGIQMGTKTRSSKGGDGHNEISMTDTKGEELITVHAERDLNVTVLGDETVHIKGNRVLKIDGGDDGGAGAEKGSGTTVTGDYTLSSSNKVSITAPTEIKLTCGGSTIKMEPGKITITAGGGASLTLDANALMLSNATSRVMLDGNAFVHSSGGSDLLLDGNANLTAASGGQVLLDGDAKLAGANVNVEAGAIAQIKGTQVKNN